MKSYRCIALLLLLAATACGTTEPIACTTEARAGITVTVTDAVTGAAIADGSTLTLREGDYVESATAAFGNSLAGAYERVGKYQVTVARAGYHTWTLAGVKVERDECHVITVPIEVQLQPIG